MNNIPQPLTELDLDQELFTRDQRQKPTRSLIDNYVLPAGGMALGGSAAVLRALGNITRAPNIYEIR